MENEKLHRMRHSLAHLLGAAVQEIFPDVKIATGPAIENGFYYDFDFSAPITDKDLGKIEQKMRELTKKVKSFDKAEISKKDAEKLFEGNPYKLELIEDYSNGSHPSEVGNPKLHGARTLTTYTSGDFTDLCAGPHVELMDEIKNSAWKLERIAGAYWKGDAKNKMLTRIYGLAFETKEELDAFEKMQEEARKRDHRKLGKELKLFTISDFIGSGLPLFQPNGMIIRKEIEDYLWTLHSGKGYDRVWTPHLAKAELYETSGHGAHYMENMFKVHGGTSKEDFFLKPMNCPHHMQIFSDNQFSYRNMPVRYFEPATVYRDEKTGQLGGLTRVRSITQDDGHLFCRVSQLHQEVKTIVNIIKEFYTTMKMIDGYKVRLSLRDEKNKANFLGSDEVWAEAESALKKVCDDEKLPYFEGKGEAAFYGPKLDFMFNDAIGREWQLATIQCDFNLPERFDLSFTNEKGEKERPVVIHRAISGSLERFMGVMIEHYSGAFPVWLAPVQIKIVPIRENHNEHAKIIEKKLKALDFRVDCDTKEGNMGGKVRDAKNMKIPYTIIIGDKDIEAKKISVESRDKGQLGQMDLKDFIEKIEKERKNRE